MRLGRLQSISPKKHKILRPKDDAFNTTRKSYCSAVTISISRDLISSKQNLVPQIYIEFKERIEKGKLNIPIKYTNSMPSIIK